MKILYKYTVPNLLKYAFNKFSNNDSFSFVDGEKNTYGDLQQKVAEVSNMLKQLGYKKHDKIAILATNSPNWVIAYLSIASIGAVVVPILPEFATNEIKKILTHSDAKGIFISSKIYSKLADKELSNFKNVFNLKNFASINIGSTIEEFDSIGAPSLSSECFQFEEIEENQLLSIIYTSGTTGTPKGVMLTHKNIIWNAERGKEIQEITQTDRMLSILPLAHTYENTIGMVLAIMSGASVFYIEKSPTPNILLTALQKIKPTVMFSVPLIIEKIYRNKVMVEINKKRIASKLYKVPLFRKFINLKAGKKVYESFGGKLRIFGIGGSKLDPTVEQFLIDAKFPYVVGYGMTETSPLIAGAMNKRQKLGSTGGIIPNLDVRIKKANPNDKTGEIQVKGMSVMQGYYKLEEKTKEVFTKDGWLRTGDLGMFDKYNRLYIKGHLKTIIIGASGENIYPEQIEALINKMDLVSESLVTHRGSRLIALVHLNMDELVKREQKLMREAINNISNTQKHLKTKSEEVIKEIHSSVNQKLNSFSRIHKMELHPVPFEKTPTMKLKRFLYRQEH